MAKIYVSVDIKAPPQKVWDIISDLDAEPKFWKGTKKTRNISKKDNTVIREITIAFRDQKCMQEITITPQTKIHARFTKGIIDGTKTMTLTSKDDITRLDASWDVRLTGMMAIFTGIIKKHIGDGTRHALDSIKAQAEGQ